MTVNRGAIDVRRLVRLLTVALFVLACDDATGPSGTVTVHIAHAASAVGPFTLSVDDEVLADPFEAGDAVVTTVDDGHHTVSWQGAGGDVAKEAQWREEWYPRVGVVLLDGADPVVRTFLPAGGVDAAVRLRMINGIPTGAPMTISLRLGSGSIDATLDYAEPSSSFGLGAGTYSVSAYFDDAESAVDLGEVALDGDTRFLVVGPDESGTAPGFVTAF